MRVYILLFLVVFLCTHSRRQWIESMIIKANDTSSTTDNQIEGESSVLPGTELPSEPNFQKGYIHRARREGIESILLNANDSDSISNNQTVDGSVFLTGAKSQSESTSKNDMNTQPPFQVELSARSHSGPNDNPQRVEDQQPQVHAEVQEEKSLILMTNDSTSINANKTIGESPVQKEFKSESEATPDNVLIPYIQRRSLNNNNNLQSEFTRENSSYSQELGVENERNLLKANKSRSFTSKQTNVESAMLLGNGSQYGSISENSSKNAQERRTQAIISDTNDTNSLLDIHTEVKSNLEQSSTSKPLPQGKLSPRSFSEFDDPYDYIDQLPPQAPLHSNYRWNNYASNGPNGFDNFDFPKNIWGSTGSNSYGQNSPNGILPSPRLQDVSNYWAASQPVDFWVSHPENLQSYQLSPSDLNYQNTPQKMAPYSNQMFNDMSYPWRPPTLAQKFPFQSKPWPPPPFSEPILPRLNQPTMDFSEFVPELQTNPVNMPEKPQRPATIQGGFCTFPFTQLDKGCYYFSMTEGETVRNWKAAKRMCATQNAHLAKMDSLQISELLKMYVKARQWYSQTWYFGLKESIHDEWQWRAPAGKKPVPMNFSLWCESEPRKGNRKCASWQVIPPSHSRFCWRAEPCSNTLKDMHFICEKSITTNGRQKRGITAKNFWRRALWLPGYVDVLEDFGNVFLP